MYVLGIDENGLGPRLGPMITTAVLLRLPGAYDAPRWVARGAAAGIDDSKRTAGAGHMASAEGLSLAMLERLSLPTHDGAAVLDALHLDGAVGRRARCPDVTTARLCHHGEPRLPRFGGNAQAGEVRLVDTLDRRPRGELLRARSVVTCVAVLNDGIGAGRSKLGQNLDAMIRLALDARAAVRAPLHVVCGRVGGIKDVAAHARALPREAFVRRPSSDDEPSYDVDGVGTMSFEIGAESKHLPVALASMLGKYVRELGMSAVVDGLVARDPELPRASGYHDPVTKRFVQRALPLLDELRIDPACFERDG